MFVLYYYVFQKTILPGDLITLMFFSFFIFNPMQELGNVIITYNETKASMENYAKLMNSKNPPTAITAFNDLLAIGAQGATDGTIAITGYDNTFLADLKQISLTSVDPGNTEIANKAAELLLNKDSNQKAKTFLMEPKLVVRNSSKSLVRNN